MTLLQFWWFVMCLISTGFFGFALATKHMVRLDDHWLFFFRFNFGMCAVFSAVVLAGGIAK